MISLPVVFSISDRGMGIRHDLLKKVYDYGFTTSGNGDEDERVGRGLFGQIIETRAAGAMHG